MTSFTACDRNHASITTGNTHGNTHTSNRLQINNLLTTSLPAERPNGQDVIDGLTRPFKSLPPKYFYDQRGSELFEKICTLPEYYPTRTEASILHSYAPKIAQLTGTCELVELGSGSSTKTRILLDAYQAQEWPLSYVPIDVSGSMLQDSAYQLLNDYSSLSIQGLISTYEPALKALPTLQLPSRMLMFIGSTLGNLSPVACEQFLQHVSNALSPGHFFLLGLDLQKEISTVEAAYNDSQGITALFNLNMLQHLNNRYQGNFCLDQFRHVAIYNAIEHQIEMYVESQQTQTVTLQQLALTVQFSKGERLLSEISRKFDPNAMAQQLAHHGLNVVQTFTDEREWFGLILAQKAG